MKPLGMIQSYLPHLPATLGSDLLALGILRSVTIITWGHCKASPKCLQGVECAGPPKPQRQRSVSHNVRQRRQPYIPQPSAQLPLKFISHTI